MHKNVFCMLDMSCQAASVLVFTSYTKATFHLQHTVTIPISRNEQHERQSIFQSFKSVKIFLYNKNIEHETLLTQYFMMQLIARKLPSPKDIDIQLQEQPPDPGRTSLGMSCRLSNFVLLLLLCSTTQGQPPHLQYSIYGLNAYLFLILYLN